MEPSAYSGDPEMRTLQLKLAEVDRLIRQMEIWSICTMAAWVGVVLSFVFWPAPFAFGFSAMNLALSSFGFWRADRLCTMLQKEVRADLRAMDPARLQQS